MTGVFAYWAIVTGVGLAALPFAELMFGRLPGRGLVFARPLGILLVAFPVWLLASLHLVPYRRAGAVVAIAVVVGAGLLLRMRGLGRPGAAGLDRTLWLAGEAVFGIAFEPIEAFLLRGPHRVLPIEKAWVPGVEMAHPAVAPDDDFALGLGNWNVRFIRRDWSHGSRENCRATQFEGVASRH